MIKHEWRESIPGGDVRYVTAKRHWGRWQFQTCLKSDEDWTQLDKLSLEDFKKLKDVLWKKYQRKRIPYEHVLEIDAMIEEAEEVDDLLEAEEISEEE